MKSISIGLLLLLSALTWAEDTPELPAEQDESVNGEDQDLDLEQVPILFNYASGDYALFTIAKLSWFQAQHLCASQGYTLVSLTTQSTESSVYDFIITSGLITTLNEPIWTSGTNLALNTQWTWWSSGASFKYRNFRTLPGNAYSCLAFDPKSKYWSAQNCNTKRYFVCEKRC